MKEEKTMRKPEYEVIPINAELFATGNGPSSSSPCSMQCALYTEGCVSQCVTFSIEECEAMTIY